MVALLLLLMQGMVAVAPAFESRPSASAPVVHVEQKDAQHADMLHNDRCVVCTARNSLATGPEQDAPAVSVARGWAVVESAPKVATPADPHAGNPSRAPPSIA